MTPSVNHHEQGNARAASGETRLRFGAKPARIAGRDQFQIRGNHASVREQPEFLLRTLPVTCRSRLANWRSGFFHSVARGVRALSATEPGRFVNSLANRRQFSRTPVTGSRALSQYVTRQSTDIAEGHCVYSVAPSHEQLDSHGELEPCSRNRGKRLTQ